MNAYVITRETRFAYDTKIVFDKRDLVEDVESCNEVAHSLWPGDPMFTLPDIEDAIEYYAQPLPGDTIHLTIKIQQDEDEAVNQIHEFDQNPGQMGAAQNACQLARRGGQGQKVHGADRAERLERQPERKPEGRAGDADRKPR